MTEEQVRKALQTVDDPELRVNIVDLGLVYGVQIDESTKSVKIDLTFTTPGCPAGPYISSQVHSVLRHLPDVADVEINIVWEPPWTPDKMSDRMKKARSMGLMP